MSETTPWWERQEARLAAEGGAGDAACSISTSETHSCKTAPDENGVMRRKCERIIKKFRMCPGRPPEELESTREETDDEVRHGGMFESSSSSSYSTSYGFGGEGSSAFPTLTTGDAPLPFPFPFGGWLGGGGEGEGGGLFGPMATMFRGMYEFAREMERLERRERGAPEVEEKGRESPEQPRVPE